MTGSTHPRTAPRSAARRPAHRLQDASAHEHAAAVVMRLPAFALRAAPQAEDEDEDQDPEHPVRVQSLPGRTT